MLSTNIIINLSMSSPLCTDSFTGIQQIAGSSWSAGLGMYAIARRTERSDVYPTVNPVKNLKPEINHEEKQGGAHSV